VSGIGGIIAFSLDQIRSTVCEWTESLYDPRTGGFRHTAQIGPNVMSTTDVVWMRYAVDAPDLATGHPHAMSAVVHAFALLQEAFPQRYQASTQFRFHWDRPEVYFSDVVAEESAGADR
jgi:hypothetical protein